MAQAEKDMYEALRLAEKGLALAGTSEEKLQWSRKNEALYRAMVQLKLRTNPQEALAYWEWYKGASLRAHRVLYRDSYEEDAVAMVRPELRFRPSQLGTDTAFVS